MLLLLLNGWQPCLVSLFVHFSSLVLAHGKARSVQQEAAWLGMRIPERVVVVVVVLSAAAAFSDSDGGEF